MRWNSKVHQSPSELSGGDQMMRRTSRTMRMKAQICLGPKDINIRTEEQENICRLLYCKDRSTGTALKQSTYQFSRSFTPCACAIFMGQRNNNNNDPYGSWALSQWLTEQRGRGRRYQNESLKDLKDDEDRLLN